MQVILSNKFSILKKDNFVINSVGINPKDIIPLINDIDTLLHFLKNQSGSYALVITKNNRLFFACVDHLASIPLYFSLTLITDIWKYIENQKDSFSTNWTTIIETYLLGGQNIGSNTQFKEINRLLPGNYFYKHKQQPYKNLYHLPIYSRDLKTTIIEKFHAAEKENNILMFSGGTDSVFLLHLIQKYKKKNWRVIHMFSKYEINNELDVVKYVESYYNCNIEKYSLEDYDSLSDIDKNLIQDQNSKVSFANYWHHEEMLPKLILLRMANISANDVVWTGEVGDQLFGGPKLSSLAATLLQQQSIDSIVNLWIELSRSYNGSFISDVQRNNFYIKKFEHATKGSFWKKTYQNLTNDISNVFYQSEISDIMIKFIHMNYLIKGQFRVWPYSQMSDYQFYHIFAEYDIAKIVFNMTSNEITPQGLLKGCLLNLFKGELPEYVWHLPKTGPTMPTERLRQRFIG